MDDFDFGIGASVKLRAFLLVALAVFMTAIGFGILEAPMNMTPMLGYLLKAFIGLVFGGIAAFCIWHAVRAIRGHSSLAPIVFDRCLTCGECSPQDVVCPVCGELPQNRSASFTVPDTEFLGQAFAALILTGVACLGVFIMIGPYLDGERRIWALIAFFALGLLLFAVGAVGFIGFLLVSWERFKGATGISFSCQGPDRSTYGTGKLAWGKLIGLKGHGQVTAPLTSQGRNEGGYRVSPGDMALAEAIATFDAAGFVELGDITAYEWSVGDPSGKTRSSANEFQRSTKRWIKISLSNAAIPHVDVADDESEEAPSAFDAFPETADTAIWRFIARYLYQPTDLLSFKYKLDADPVHRTQLEMHACVLRDRGIVVSNVLVEAVLEGLLRE